MNTQVKAAPNAAARRPSRIESRPSEGPTVRSSSVRMRAGSAPARRTSDSSSASAGVKFPSIWPLVRISARITGADLIFPSSTIGICLPMCSRVKFPNRSAAPTRRLKATTVLLHSPWEACAFCRSVPVITAVFSTAM